jgi:hypothetical protein
MRAMAPRGTWRVKAAQRGPWSRPLAACQDLAAAGDARPRGIPRRGPVRAGAPQGRPDTSRPLFFDGPAGAAQVLPEAVGRISGAPGQVVIEGGLLAQRPAFPDLAGLVPFHFADLARGG